jgi:hypothetical protein
LLPDGTDTGQDSLDPDNKMQAHRQLTKSLLDLLLQRVVQKVQKNSCSDELVIGIAEGGARTHDLEVDLFAVIRATRSTD